MGSKILNRISKSNAVFLCVLLYIGYIELYVAIPKYDNLF